MSASTVSGTANPRRRSSALSDAKQGIEIINDATISPNFDTNVSKNDEIRVTTSGNNNNKDLSHSIRGEAVVEKSKEKKSLQLQQQQQQNSIPPNRGTRNRKTTMVSKTPKPKWQTLLKVFVKNLLVLLVLVGLIQMGRRLMMSGTSLGGGSGNLMGFSDMEGRISGVESSLKTTTKMMQMQVDVVDRKIESEVGNLRREISKRVEEKSVQLKKLEEKSDSLEVGLSELKSKAWTKEDLVRLFDEMKRGEVEGSVGLSYDEIRGLAKEVVEKEIEKHAADGLGRADYALYSGGARVLFHSEPLFLSKGVGLFSGRKVSGVHGDAEKMLKPSFGEPGECFPLKGNSGFVTVRLRTAIYPEAVTLEHVAESVSYDRSSAPKQCRVYGWFQGQKVWDDNDRAKMFLLTEFTYDLEKSNAQTFNVLDETRASVVDAIMFEFSSNHGSPSHTCIYRLRVHGHEPESVPVIPDDF